MTLPFPNVEFQPFLTEIASLKPDAVFVFFAGAGAAKFVKRLCRCRPEGQHPALRPGLPHRRQPGAMGGAGEGC
jgi:branched-chain amino acid transport system substrate-binding protein